MQVLFFGRFLDKRLFVIRRAFFVGIIKIKVLNIKIKLCYLKNNVIFVNDLTTKNIYYDNAQII